MPFWTRLRPGKQPLYNIPLADFPGRARYRRLAREMSILLRRPDDYVPPLLLSLARQAAYRAARSDYDPRLDELPF